jgi:hypothetical protein
VIVSHEHKMIFIKTHKTAGTSIEVLLSGLVEPGAVVTPIPEDDPAHHARNWSGSFNPIPELLSHPRRVGETLSWWRQKRAYYEHNQWWRIRPRVGAEIWESYFKFCVERDPWDKVVSYYFWRVRDADPQPSFDEWLRGMRPSRRDRLSDWSIYGKGDGVVVDHVIRYENLADELPETLARVGIDATSAELPRVKSGFRKGRVELSPWARDQVRSLFAHEIRYFGYPDEPPAAV